MNEKDKTGSSARRNPTIVPLSRITTRSLFSSVYVKSLQEIQGFQIANLEEIALRKGWISHQALEASLSDKGNSTYNSYLRQILKDPGHYNPHIT